MTSRRSDSYRGSEQEEGIIKSILSVVYPDVREAAEQDIRDLLRGDYSEKPSSPPEHSDEARDAARYRWIRHHDMFMGYAAAMANEIASLETWAEWLDSEVDTHRRDATGGEE